jgi:AAA15 family ATPase/GTPase
MIKQLEISNFKSVKQLKQDVKRINVFIGNPNSGKSNILEALGLISYTQFGLLGSQLTDFVRYNRTTNLFYDDSIEQPILVKLDSLSLEIEFASNQFRGKVYMEPPEPQRVLANLSGNFNQLALNSYSYSEQDPSVKYYKFSVLDTFNRSESAFLLPPSGSNLMALLLTKSSLKTIANDIFLQYGLRLSVKPHENTIEIVKDSQGVFYTYPYKVMSDTLQRVIFHLAAILSNKNSILVFEEPESHTFPFYTKHIAEIIADDTKNQYFIATHNPYFLEPIVERTPKEDLNVIVTYFEDFQTKTRILERNELDNLMTTDIFSNFDMYIKKS